MGGQSSLQCSHAQWSESQDQQGNGPMLGGQEANTTAGQSEGQGMQRDHTVVGNMGNQEPTGTVPQSDGHRGHGTGNRVPIRPIGRPRSHAYWDGTQWVLTPEAALRCKEQYRKARDRQNERRRVTRQMLKEMEPKKKIITLDRWA